MYREANRDLEWYKVGSNDYEWGRVSRGLRKHEVTHKEAYTRYFSKECQLN